MPHLMVRVASAPARSADTTTVERPGVFPRADPQALAEEGPTVVEAFMEAVADGGKAISAGSAILNFLNGETRYATSEAEFLEVLLG